MKRASILINNYNYAVYLRECIESALAQDYPEKEVVVVDDGSTDGSRDIIRSYGDQVIPVFKGNGGQASAFNAGFAASTGDVVFILDSDDCFHPAKLRTMMPRYDDFQIGWCHDQTSNDPSATQAGNSAADAVDARAAMRRGIFPSLPIPTSTLSFRRDVLAKILPMPVADGVVLSDNYLKFAGAFLAPGMLLEQALTFQRLHEHNRYTDKPDAWRLRMDIMRATGYALASRYPELKQLGLELVAGGLSDNRIPQQVVRDYMAAHIDSRVFGSNAKLRCLLLVAKKRLARALRANPLLSQVEKPLRARFQH